MSFPMPPYSCLWDEGAGSSGARCSSTRTALPGDLDVDVCIVGGGFTGLWTAWHLKQLEPSLRIAVLEKHRVGFGASGRNGGWVQTALPSSVVELAATHSIAAALAVHRNMVETVMSIGSFADTYAPLAGFARCGQLNIARTPGQVARLSQWVADHHRIGMDESDYRWLSPDEVGERISLTRALGGYFTPHCAVVNPRPLVEALATACESLGVHIFEETAATAFTSRCVRTDHGDVRCSFTVRATEGYTSGLPETRRDLLPVFSLMIGTEPLTETVWEQLGWSDRFSLSDGRRSVIYAQRTADNRIAFGGRGAPYRFGSNFDDRFADNISAHSNLRDALVDLFPVLSTVAVTHRWGGVLGVPRDWTAGLGLDRSTGAAWAGGYVGDGVAATHLAGQTLADLILGRDTDRTALPWVGHRSRRWEPEPIRCIGVRSLTHLAASVDRAEELGKPARLRSKVLDSLL